MESERLLRLPETEGQMGKKRSALYQDISDGVFTPGIPLSTSKNGRAAAVAWPHSEVQAIIRARIAGKTEDELKALVRELVAKRQSAELVAA